MKGDGAMVYKGTAHGRRWVFAALAALECLMSFTFLGYIHVAPISITFAYLPILIAGCFLGVKEAGALGALFGLASLYKASAYYVLPTDQVFSPFFSASPWASLCLSVGVRTLFGLLAGALLRLGRRGRHPRLWTGVVAALSPKLHGAMVYGAMGLLFPQLGYSVGSALHVGVSDVLLALLCAGVIEGLWAACSRPEVRRLWRDINRAGEHKPRMRFAWLAFLACALGAAAASAIYFAQRMVYMLEAHGLALTDQAARDLLHLQVQSLMATLALSFLMAVCLLLVYRYVSYRERMGRLDALTGVMGRGMFHHACEEALGRLHAGAAGWFLFIDVGYFKSINDTLGHPAGDRVLTEVAQALTRLLPREGILGRMGGDEFAALLPGQVGQQELETALDRFQAAVAAILPAPETVSCSIGACRFFGRQAMDALYAQTDRLLYAAKRQGRARYILGQWQAGELKVLDSAGKERTL